MMRARIDFIHEKERPARLATMLLTGSVLMLTGALAILTWHQQGVENSSRVLKDRQALIALNQVQQQQDQALMASRLSHLQDKRWKTALRQLNTPWFPVLSAIEDSAIPPAYIMSTRLDPERGTLELDVIAPQFNDALHMVDHLQSLSALTQARLVTREAPQPGSPGGDSRFVIHAAWGEPRHAR